MNGLKKKLDEYYSDIDKDRVWEKISEELDFPPEEHFGKRPVITKRTGLLPLMSAAAVIIVSVFIGLNLISPNDIALNDSGAADSAPSAEDSIEMTYPPAEEAEEEPEIFFPSEKGWSYSTVSLSSAKSYSYSDFDSVISPSYENNRSDDFFVEAEILENADFFLDCVVEEITDVSENGVVTYAVSPVHVICPEDRYLSPVTVIKSSAAYVLAENREYLVPISVDGTGEYVITDSSAPQIMLTDERFVIYQNGWHSLSGGGEMYLQKDSLSSDDFFFDRMFITEEKNLQGLFDSFYETKEKKKK